MIGSLISFLVFGQTAFATPAQLIELGTTITLSQELINSISHPKIAVFIQNKRIVDQKDVSPIWPYCSVFGPPNKPVRVVDEITYIAGKYRDHSSILDLDSNGPDGITNFRLTCQTDLKYELSAQDLSGIFGDLIQVNYVLGADAGSIFNLSTKPNALFTITESFEIPTVTSRQPDGLVMKDGLRVKGDLPNSVRFSNNHTYPLVYSKGTQFLLSTGPSYIVFKKTNSKHGISRRTYSIVNVRPTNNPDAIPFRLYVNSDRNAELSLDEVKHNLGPVFEFH